VWADLLVLLVSPTKLLIMAAWLFLNCFDIILSQSLSYPPQSTKEFSWITIGCDGFGELFVDVDTLYLLLRGNLRPETFFGFIGETCA
jgi:hypothetical protein